MPLIGPLPVDLNGRSRGPRDSVWGYVWLVSGWHQLGVSALAVVVAALTLVPIELQRRLVDDAITPGDITLLTRLGLLYVGAFLTLRLTKFALSFYQAWIAESAVRNTRGDLTSIYRNRDPDDEGESGEAVSVTGPETEKLGGFVGVGISEAVSNLAMLLGIVGYMLWVQTTMALFALAMLVPQLVITPFLQRKLNRLTGENVELRRTLGDMVASEALPDAATTERKLDDIYDNRLRHALWRNLLKGLLNLLNGGGPILVLVVGGWLAIQGQTTVGVIVAFISAFDRLAAPARGLIDFYRQWQTAEVQHRMIAKWMSPKIPRGDKRDRTDRPSEDGPQS